MGGKALTRGAQNEFDKLQDAHLGKTIAHVTNDGLANIESHYKALNTPENVPPSTENNGTGIEEPPENK